MQVKWLAVIAIWLAVGSAVVGCAFAWGAQGRWTVAFMAIVGFFLAAVATGSVSSGKMVE